MRISDILFAVSVLVCFPAWALAADEAAPKQYLVHIKLKQLQTKGDVEDGVEKVLANPNLALVAGRNGDFVAGGKVPIGDERFMRYGTRMKMRLNPTDERKIHIAGKIEVSVLLGDSSPAKHVAKRGTTIYLNEVVELGKASTITLGDQT